MAIAHTQFVFQQPKCIPNISQIIFKIPSSMWNWFFYYILVEFVHLSKKKKRKSLNKNQFVEHGNTVEM